MSEEIYKTAEQRITEIVEQADSNGWTNEDLILHLMGPVNAAISKSRKRELDSLYAELGTLKWMGEDEGWDLAIEAVRKRLVELISN